jgi:hypothetical protein
MPAPTFRRNRTRGVTQASIERAIRAAKAAAPDAVVEFDPIDLKIRITNVGARAAAATANPWDEVLTDAAKDAGSRESGANSAAAHAHKERPA